MDRFSQRLEESNTPGSDLAIAYLKEKYNRNMTAATISQAGSVLHSFLLLLHESGRDLHQLTSKDIGRFVERDQDNGLKSGAIRTKLQSLYAFISFLVELLDNHKKPAAHWQHIRTSNPIESTFATVRLRTAKTRGCVARNTILSMVFKLGQSAQKRWRKLRGFRLLAEVIRGVQFRDGERIEQLEGGELGRKVI